MLILVLRRYLKGLRLVVLLSGGEYDLDLCLMFRSRVLGISLLWHTVFSLTLVTHMVSVSFFCILCTILHDIGVDM